MQYGKECLIAKNENQIKSLQIKKVEMSQQVQQLRERNRELKGKSFKKHLKAVTIELVTTSELDYCADYMGRCKCGCGKNLYKGMTVIAVRGNMVHIDCLEKFLKEHMVVL